MEKISLKNYIENVEKAILNSELLQKYNSFTHLDLLEDSLKKNEIFEDENYQTYKFIIDSIYDYFDSIDQGFIEDKKGSVKDYKEKLLSNIDYFKFKNKILTKYEYNNSPFNNKKDI